MSPTAVLQQLRLDKWLWTARFFKTRALAADAIKSGKVLVNDVRAKPSKNIQPGDELRLRRGAFEYELTVLGVSAQRASATAVAGLYREHPQSVARRESIAEQLRAEVAADNPGRPTKRGRRQILRFTQKRAN
ncbi:MAG: RNA-binding S4 domain-containing protein [Gammaproteobacteria bacterium]